MITFYRTTDPYGFMSNFSKHSFIDDKGRQWPTSEHYYQAGKFAGHEDIVEMIRQLPTARAAADTGRRRDLPLREDWDEVKDDVMREALGFKFRQNLHIQELLINTGYSPLAEDSHFDYYWGRGADGSGQNRLGVLLMELRTQLRGEETDRAEAARTQWLESNRREQ